MHYLPLSLPFFFMLGGILVLLVIWVEIRALTFAYQRAGISSPAALFMLFASWVGGYVNIPLFWLHGRPVMSDQQVDFFGMQYVVPTADWQGTVLAVNVGGCVIPVLLSLYILAKYDLWVLGAVGTAIVAVITHMMATPVHGVGIALPIFVPPIITAIVAAILSRTYAGPACLCQRQPRRADWRGSLESEQSCGPWRAGRVDRRGPGRSTAFS